MVGTGTGCKISLLGVIQWLQTYQGTGSWKVFWDLGFILISLEIAISNSASFFHSSSVVMEILINGTSEICQNFLE
ncbi:hypothetical protein B6N60_03950 [Richelia sinica FACHB-800]|uniref:Uncharacterized protein n=1 Tax=Richelia sinica FACHB-800 TaxID=1357546 RepID=A0A975TAJ0_9NOST|nr:hypothetical protein [Richelia sinica]MBD2664611.1 hypothetical protein [Richelia sinica FACHB-800]QXE25236.1 hypothetical protein B6N60_03950 [Richelia sinica FACHB-800]